MWIRVAVAFLLISGTALQAEEIRWRTSLADGLKAARENHSLVYVQVVTEWCGYCRKLQADDYPRPEIKALLTQFVTVTIDGDRQPEVANGFKARGYPTLLVLQPDGTIIARIDGYPGPERLKQTLSQILSENKMAGLDPTPLSDQKNNSRKEEDSSPTSRDEEPSSIHPLDIALQAMQSKEFRKALDILNPFISESTSSNTEFALARFYRGMTLMELGQFEKARSDLDFASRRAPMPEQRESAAELLKKLNNAKLADKSPLKE
ncbi:MAG: hypothetical protein CMF59_01535 [Leptospiraceae bacterium]|nr:hypothetical protein [Leptospiraceae bacterium]